ncbi:TRAP transporter substrate-binding protein [Caballeronia sp. LZ034LL]|uniref:TRAP transporter substrate-binding protein n=1 Tax=Caballeronia sp. LZ034LL TaxID=3038567 RepID=UPI0028606354|nr:TRAP transporter substrate-binding protein [Caballeronia sp. LZ034LL]MDR5835612.1 TRAP transporter substrate-binding protein [Caballeronia sp. LZ034LL]
MRDYLLSRRKLLTLTVASAAAGCLPRLASADSQTIRIGDVVDRHNPEVITENLMAKRLKETTGFDARVFPDGVLGSHTRMNEQLRNGTLEITVANVADLEGYDKRLGLFAMPFAFPDRKTLFAAQDGALGEAYAGILEKLDFVLLGWFDSGLRSVYNRTRAINEPNDMKGLKIRTQGNQIMIATFNQFGAQATPLDTTQIYSALQQGVVDGAENSVTFFVQQHHSEVAKHYSYTNHFFSIDPMLASKKWFDSLDPKKQDAVKQAAAQAQQHERELWLASDAKYLAEAKKNGVEFNDTNSAAFRAAVKPIYAKYRSNFAELAKYLPDL